MNYQLDLMRGGARRRRHCMDSGATTARSGARTRLGHQDRSDFSNATEAFVSEAVRVDGEQVVLKISLGGAEASAREVRTLQAANGRG